MHRVVALHGKERLQKLRRVDPQQVPVLSLEQPKPDVSKRLKNASVPAFGPLRSGSHSPQTTELPGKKRDNLVRFAQAICPEDDCFRFAKWHRVLSGKHCRRADNSLKLAQSFNS